MESKVVTLQGPRPPQPAVTLTSTNQSWSTLHRGWHGHPRAALTSATSYKFGGLEATFISGRLATNLGAPTNPSGLIICQDNSQNSGKLYTYEYRYMIAKMTQTRTSHRQRHIEQGLGGPVCEASLPLGHVTLQHL